MCTSNRVFIGNMCLSPNNAEYIAFLPAVDGLDTFSLAVGPGMFSMRKQSNPDAPIFQTGGYTPYPQQDSIFINSLSAPGGTGAWPDSLNGKPFVLHFYGALKHPTRDTLSARIRWIGLGSGTDLRPPLDFTMLLVR